MAIIFANNILITDYLNISTEEIVNSLSDKIFFIKSYFVNKNV